MNKWLLALIFVLLSTNLNAGTTQSSSQSVVCTPTVHQNTPSEGDTTTVTVCRTTTVITTTVTTDAYTTTSTQTVVSEDLTTVSTEAYHGNTYENILVNPNFQNPNVNRQYSWASTGWSITGGHTTHSRLSSPSNATQEGGSVGMKGATNISQTVSSLKDATGMSEAELQHGWKSTLSANIWFWINYENNVTLKQTITDSAGNVTVQQRVIEDDGCGSGADCGVYVVYDDTYIQGSNTATDFSIRVDVSNDSQNWNLSDSYHRGPDIDDIMLKIQHNEITTETVTTTHPATSSSSSTSSYVDATTTEIVYCWQKVPSTCAEGTPGLDDVEEQITDAVTTITTEDVTVIDVTNLDVETLEIVNVTLDEAITQELSVSEPETTFEEAFTNIVEEAGLEETFSDALAEEDITEQEFFEEVEEVMEEEMASTTEVETETEVTEETTETSNEETTEEVQESDSDVEEQVEGSGETELAETDSEDASVGEITVEDKVADIQAKIEKVIAKVEAKLKRVDLKLKATAFVLAKAMVDQQPDMSEYTQKEFYKTVQLPDNTDWYAEATILEAYGRSIYQDITLAAYQATDPVAQYEQKINTVNNNISVLEAELEVMRNELNQ
jgi:hypothetical protein